MKEQIIQIPDNLEVKEIKNGKIILVEKEKKLTYEDVAEKLFPVGGSHFYITAGACIEKSNNSILNYKLENNTTSKKQAKKLLAINKLMNVAKYLNCYRQPDWNDNCERKWFIYFSNEHKQIKVDYILSMQQHFVYFKSKELAEQAIEILGEETIRLALCTDY